MENSLYFYLVFFITVLITRIFLYYKPTPSPTIKGFRMHHYMYGLVLAPLGILISSITIYAVGLGLFIDELGYLLIKGKNHQDNYSKKSLLLLAIFVILTYIFKEQLLFWI